MASFNGYLLEDAARATLEKLAGGYAYVVKKADHITESAPVEDFRNLKPVSLVEVTGFVSDNNGIEAFLIAVDGQERRADGERYHLTWSLDPRREIPDAYKTYENGGEGAGGGRVLYQSRHSNSMLRAFFEGASRGISAVQFPRREQIQVTPALVLKDAAGRRHVRKLVR